MATLLRADRRSKVCPCSFHYPVIRRAVPSIDDPNGDIFSKSHFELIVTGEQLMTAMMGIEQLEEEIRGIDLKAEEQIDYYDLGMFRVRRHDRDGIMDDIAIREWIGCIKRDFGFVERQREFR